MNRNHYMSFFKRLFFSIILISGLVSCNKDSNKTQEAETLNELNFIISNDKRNINMLIPIRDGLMLCIKNE